MSNCPRIRATNGPLTKIWVVWHKLDFSAKTEILGPKKGPLLQPNHVLAKTGKGCSKKKVTSSQINISLIRNFGWFFGLKPIFGQKTLFSPTRKRPFLHNSGPDRVCWHSRLFFLMARTVPPSFVENGPKLRVLIPLSWHKPKTAKNRGEPQKMTPSSETEFFLGWFQWESCSPGYSGHLLHWQKSRSLYKKLTFGPKYPNFWVKKAHFRP